MCLSGGCGSPERGDTIDGHAESLRKRKIKLADPADAIVRAKSQTTKVWFICCNKMCSFIWNAQPYSVIAAARPTSCPHCGDLSTTPLCPAEKDCQVCVPKSLFARLDNILLKSGLTYTGSRDARTIRASTHEKLRFKHTCGHTVEMAGNTVISGTGCGFCSDPPQRLCPSDAECAICLRKTVAGAADALAAREVEYDTTKNPKPADQVFLQSHTICSWKCKTVDCGHTWRAATNNVCGKQRSSCPHCGDLSTTPLCPAEKDCPICVPKSLYAKLSKLFEKGLMYTGTLDTRTIRASTHQKLSFKHTCGHTIEMTGFNVISNDQGCGFCSDPPKRLCPSDAECAICLRKTVAGAADALAEREVEYDTTKNKPADQVFLQSHAFIWWRCKASDCGQLWRAAPNDVCGKRKSGCGRCAASKTERMVFERLLELTASTERDVRMDWCTNTSGRCALPFDMVARVDSAAGVQLNVIVEVDGAQHFGDCPFFNKSRSYQDILNTDRYKMQCALSQGYHVVRVHQEDAWKRRVDVLLELAGVLEEIRHAPAPGVWLIAADEGVYARHSLENGQEPTQPSSGKRKAPAIDAC